MKKKILVTGGTGFIGRPIVRKLLAAGYQLEILTTNIKQQSEESIRYHYLDLADKKAVAKLVTALQAKSLLHLAWNVQAADFASASENSLWIDYSMNLAQNFLQAGGQEIICAGTCFEYDFSGGLDIFTEIAPLQPNTFYGECKKNLWEQLQLLSKEYQARLVWGRIFYPYGAEEEPRKLISAVINKLKNNQEFICNTPKNILDYVYIEDVADCFVHLLASKAQGDFNICSGQGVSVQDILLKLASSLGKAELIKFNENAQPIKIIGSTDKFDRLVKYWQRKSFTDGISNYLLH